MVDELARPKEESVDAVWRWLEQYNVQKEDCKMSDSGDWVRARVPVALAEKMLDTVRFLTWSIVHLAPVD